MYDPILLTLDGSSLAEEAIPHAMRMAGAFDARVILLRVVPLIPADDLTTGTVYYQLLDVERAAAEQYVALKARELARDGARIEPVVLTGDPAATIVDVAAQRGVRLLVTATHGRSGVSRWVFGSVAERVVRAAPCPVMLVRVAAAAAPSPEARP